MQGDHYIRNSSILVLHSIATHLKHSNYWYSLRCAVCVWGGVQCVGWGGGGDTIQCNWENK